MTRLYHSASSDALGQRCPRAWWYRYVAGIKEPRVEWSTIAHYVADRDGKTWRDPADPSRAVPSRARSTALGTEMHARHEARYLGARVVWDDLPGQVALSGLHFLPDPAKARVKVEAPIGDAAIVGAKDDHAPPVGFRVAGVLWAGYRDLVAYAPEEHARLGIHGDWTLYDYKSSSDVARYALTPAELQSDFAANLYALATCTELDLEWVRARWIYFETKRRRYAEPRDVVITRKEAFERVAAGSERARVLDAITSETDAPANTNACGDYGGCPYHSSAGGPCSAQRSFGQLMQARIVRKESPMALPPGITQLKQPNGQQFAPPPAVAQTSVNPPPTQTFAGFAPPPAEAPAEVPAAAAPPPPAPEAPAKGKRGPRIQAPAIAPTGDVYDFDVEGDFAPLKFAGDARDVIKAAKLWRGAQ